MKVGELRKSLEGVSDDLEVIRRDETFLTWVSRAQRALVSEHDDDSDHLGIGEEADSGRPYFLVD